MKHIKWIDTMKGIGILAVVAGHIYGGITTRIIFLFHMPLFFFISGYLFSPKINIKQYFYDKSIHLLIPYLSFLIPLYFFFHRISLIDSTFGQLLEYFYIPIIGGRALGGATGIFWFITCLFLVQQLMNIMLVKMNSKKILILSTAMLFLSYINSLFFPDFWLPLNANVLLAAIPYFYLGYQIKKKEFKSDNIFITILAAFVVLFTIYFPKNTYDMKNAFYGIPIITLLSSIILVLFVKNLSVLVSKFHYLSKYLIELGKASMVIMFMHQPLQMVISRFLTTDMTIRFIVSTFCSYILYLIIFQYTLTRGLLLGSKNDFKIINARLAIYFQGKKVNNE